MTDATVPDATPTTVETPSRNLGIVKWAGILGIVGGIALIVVGVIAWIAVTTQLTAENITIPDDAVAMQGQQVTGPITAYIQADIINAPRARGDRRPDVRRAAAGDPRPAPDAGVVPARIAVHVGRRVRRRAVRRRDGRALDPLRLGVRTPGQRPGRREAGASHLSVTALSTAR